MEKQLLMMNNNNSDDAIKKKKKNKAAEEKEEKEDANTLNGLFPPISPTTRIFWNSRKRSANGQRLQKENEDSPNGQRLRKENENSPKTPTNKQEEESMIIDNAQEPSTAPVLSERRKALFEPLEPAHGMNSRLSSGEVLFPPPDFDAASYPKGWLIGKKRKLVNVDVVESMRRIAVQEMNRKDREINGLNEQLEEDARALEHLQVQLLQERSKRADVERENSLLQNQVSMLMNMLQEEDGGADEGDGGGADDS